MVEKIAITELICMLSFHEANVAVYIPTIHRWTLGIPFVRTNFYSQRFVIHSK